MGGGIFYYCISSTCLPFVICNTTSITVQSAISSETLCAAVLEMPVANANSKKYVHDRAGHTSIQQQIQQTL